MFCVVVRIPSISNLENLAFLDAINDCKYNHFSDDSSFSAANVMSFQMILLRLITYFSIVTKKYFPIAHLEFINLL